MKKNNPAIQFISHDQTNILTRLVKKFIIIMLAGISVVNAQSTWCGNDYNGSADQSSSSTACWPYLLSDLRQQSADREIEVNVVVTVFAPTTNSSNSVWFKTAYSSQNSVTTYTDAVKLIADANWRLANLATTPNLGGATALGSAKIKLVLTGFNIYNDDQCYTNINSNYAPSQNTFTSNLDYYDEPNAIHIVFGGYDPIPTKNQIYTGKNDGSIPVTYPENWIRFHPTNYYSFTSAWDNIRYYGVTLAHEMGHALGLNHTWNTEYFSKVSPNFGCCTNNVMYANDYPLETASNVNSSNNLMCINAVNMEYLSPLQTALMHYNLRTSMKRFLSASGYTAALTTNTALNYNVTSNEIWSDDRYFGGNIIVKQGKTLTVQCGVAMTKGSRIIVEKGAQLFIDGGKITNISGELWDGIEVCGDPAQPQTMYNPLSYYNTPGLAQYQGVVRMFSGEISNASNGIKTYTTTTNGTIDWNSTGGILICYSANFINNVRDVEFMYYNSPQGINVSKFINCNFKTTAALNTSAWPYTHVSLYQVNGVQFKGCLFENSYATMAFLGNSSNMPYDPGRGIHSADAVYTVDMQGTNPSIFRQLETGIKAENSNPLKVVTIKNSEFYNNVTDAVYFKNVNNFTFEKNYVSAPYYFTSTGLYLNNCANYSVKTCTFTENTTQSNKGDVGIYVYNSKKGAHQIYNNSFSNFEQGISAIADNSGNTNTIDGLKMNCNDFTQVSNKYDIAMLPYNQFATVMKTQGVVTTDPKTLVRNRYSAPSSCSNCENKWFIAGSSYRPIMHGSNSNSNTQPSPQPQNSDLDLNIIPSGISFQSVHCSDNPGTLGGVNTTGPKSIALNNYLSSLKEAHNESNDLTFDIEATASEKMGHFAADTSDADADSLIATLNNNASFIQNNDILRIYAYMHKGDYESAQTLTDELGEGRETWRDLLLTQIAIEQTEGKAYSLIAGETTAFLEGLAGNDTLDGCSIAQSLLKLGFNSIYNEPRLHPQTEGEKAAHENIEINTQTQEAINSIAGIRVYPNPAQTDITIYLPSKESEKLTAEIRDLPGRIIYSNFITTSAPHQIPLKNISNGIYILSIKNTEGQIIYQSKIVKQ